MKKKIIVLVIAFLLNTHVIAINLAEKKQHEYFNAVAEIQKLPAKAFPILQCNMATTKKIIALLTLKERHDIFGGEPKYFETGVMDQYGENITLYEGDFSNEQAQEYLFLSSGGGSLKTDTVAAVYKLLNQKLIKLDFDNIIIKNILPNQDLSNFYLSVADPFIYRQGHFTYLRFIDLPPQDDAYNKHKLKVCTYLWQKNSFKLIGPQVCIGGKIKKA